MKKSIVSFATLLTVFSLVVTFSVSAQAVHAQTIVNCPAGYVCTPVAQVTNCPAGYICTPQSSASSGGSSVNVNSLVTPNTTTVVSTNTNSCTDYTFTTNLSVGSRSKDVVALQIFLIAQGFNIRSVSSGAASKGYFGTQTASVLAQYQKSVGLPVTGKFDPATRAYVNNIISPNGCSGSSIAPSVTPAVTPFVNVAPTEAFPVITNQTRRSCSLSQIWNGSNCVTPATQITAQSAVQTTYVSSYNPYPKTYVGNYNQNNNTSYYQSQATPACVQLGSQGSFVAPASGMLTLYFNDNGFGDNGGSYSAIINGQSISVDGTSQGGTQFGQVVAGQTYSYSTNTGNRVRLNWAGPGGGPYDTSYGSMADPDGIVYSWDNPTVPVASTVAGNGFICPGLKALSLVGKIDQGIVYSPTISRSIYASSLNLGSGAPGTSIIMSGTGFEQYDGVCFYSSTPSSCNGVSATSVTSNQLAFSVPNLAAGSYTVKARRGDALESNGLPFTINSATSVTQTTNANNSSGPVITNVNVDKTSYNVGDSYTVTWNLAGAPSNGFMGISLFNQNGVRVYNIVNTCGYVSDCVNIPATNGGGTYTGTIPAGVGSIGSSVSNGQYKFEVSLIASGAFVTDGVGNQTVSIPLGGGTQASVTNTNSTPTFTIQSAPTISVMGTNQSGSMQGTSTIRATFNVGVQTSGSNVYFSTQASSANPMFAFKVFDGMGTDVTSTLVNANSGFIIPNSGVVTAGQPSNSFYIPPQSSVVISNVTFQFAGKDATGAALTAGPYSVQLDHINWSLTGAGSATTATSFAGLVNWRTSAVNAYLAPANSALTASIWDAVNQFLSGH